MGIIESLKFWKRSESKPIGELLSKEQKKKYRKQYKKVMFNALVLSLAYIGGIVSLIDKLFSTGEFWTLAVTIILLESYVQRIKEWKDEIELIVQRVKKRTQKNIKQGENK